MIPGIHILEALLFPNKQNFRSLFQTCAAVLMNEKLGITTTTKRIFRQTRVQERQDFKRRLESRFTEVRFLNLLTKPLRPLKRVTTVKVCRIWYLYHMIPRRCDRHTTRSFSC